MNENPGETPNPLNPNPGMEPEINNPPLDANPSEAVDNAPMNGAPITDTTPVVDESQAVDPLAQATVGITDQPMNDPMARPMEQAPVVESVEPPKKKKTGLIIGIIVALVLAIGCGVAAVLLLMNQGDPVSKAAQKIIGGNAPANVSASGTINVTPTDETSALTSLKIELNTDATSNSLINATTAKLTASIREVGDISLNLEERYAESGDLYFKIDGAADAIDKLTTMAQNTMPVQNCEDDDVDCIQTIEDETNCIEGTNCIAPEGDSDLFGDLAPFMTIVNSIDGVWLKVSTETLTMLSNSIDQDATKCLSDLTSEIKNNKNSLAELYDKNPFIGSTTENVSLESKNGKVYRVVFDNEKFNAFGESLKDSDLVKKAKACLGEENVTFDENASQELENIPNIYVEVDGDNNFSRVYFELDIKGSSNSDMTFEDFEENSDIVKEESADASKTIAHAIVDLDFTYPDTINVAEPTDSTDVMTLIQQLMTTFNGGGSGVEPQITE